jgi:hypothetical protein
MPLGAFEMRVVWIGLALSAGAVLLAACQTPTSSAAAKPSPQAAHPVAQQASGDLQSGKICKTVQTTGSRFSTKECHTAAEWAAIQNQGLDSLYNEDPPHSR